MRGVPAIRAPDKTAKETVGNGLRTEYVLLEYVTHILRFVERHGARCSCPGTETRRADKGTSSQMTWTSTISWDATSDLQDRCFG